MRARRRLFVVAIAALALGAGTARADAAVFLVTSTAATGEGTLWKAIEDANAFPGPDQISFAIGLGGPQRIETSWRTPEITDPVTIDGTTQPGVLPGTGPGIEIDGEGLVPGNASALHMSVAAAGTVIRGLAIFDAESHGVELRGAGSRLVGSWVGRDRAGWEFADNYGGGVLAGDGTIVGGAAPGDGNLFVDGVNAIDVEGDGVRVIGNRVGTTPDGMDRDPYRSSTIRIDEDATATIVGGTAAGEGNQVWGTILDLGASTRIIGNTVGLDATGEAAISGAGGISLHGIDGLAGGATAAERNVVLELDIRGERNRAIGNYIGTDATGQRPLVVPTWHEAVYLSGQALRFGGPGPGEGNVVATTKGDVVSVFPATDQKIEGNTLGLDSTGSRAIGSQYAAIDIYGGISDQRVAIRGNVVSGSIRSESGEAEIVIQGNTIGLDRTGETRTARPSSISIRGGRALIGGTEPGDGNLVAGAVGINSHKGVWGPLARVLGNTIGLSRSGAPVGDDGPAIVAITQAQIGDGSAAGANHISNAGGAAIEIDDYFLVPVSVRGNRLHDNGGLAIDRGDDGPTPSDDPDADTVPNAPAVTGAVEHEGKLHVHVELVSRPDTEHLIDLYSNRECDPSGFGEAEEHLGEAKLATDSEGRGAATIVLDGVPGDQIVTTTATAPEAGTSEVSRCRSIAPGGGVAMADTAKVAAEADGRVALTVERSDPLDTPATVHWSTRDGSATAPDDFSPTSGSLELPAGAASAEIEVQLSDDGIVEPDADFEVVLDRVSGDAVLGAPDRTTVTVTDSGARAPDPPPPADPGPPAGGDVTPAPGQAPGGSGPPGGTPKPPGGPSDPTEPAPVARLDSLIHRIRSRVRTLRSFSGRATGARRVEIALVRLERRRRCRTLNSRGRLGRASARSCRRPRWHRARGATRWRYRLRRRLPAGRYILRSRAVDTRGRRERGFSRSDRNYVRFSVVRTRRR